MSVRCVESGYALHVSQYQREEQRERERDGRGWYTVSANKVCIIQHLNRFFAQEPRSVGLTPCQPRAHAAISYIQVTSSHQMWMKAARTWMECCAHAIFRLQWSLRLYEREHTSGIWMHRAVAGCRSSSFGAHLHRSEHIEKRRKVLHVPSYHFNLLI